MTRIKIFVASAKELHQERGSLKSLANDLTVEYAQAGHNVSVTINDYENFGDDQKIYNDFIQRRASGDAQSNIARNMPTSPNSAPW